MIANYKLSKYVEAFQRIEEGIIFKLGEQLHRDDVRDLLQKDPEGIKRLRGVDEDLVDKWIWIKKLQGKYGGRSRERNVVKEIKPKDVDKSTPLELILIHEKVKGVGRDRIALYDIAVCEGPVSRWSLRWQKLKKKWEEIKESKFWEKVREGLKDFEEHKGAAYFLEMAKEAESIQQDDRVSDCLEGMMVDRYEEILRKEGVCRYIKWKDLKKLEEKAKRGVIRSGFLEDYRSRLPKETVRRVKELNELYIFDNWLVVEGKEEVWLFGIFSNKCYYVDTWIQSLI